MTFILYDNGVLEKDGWRLSIDELNPNYIEYLEWLALGNSPIIRPASEYFAKLQDVTATQDELKTQYQAAIDRLTEIINMPNPTQVNLATLTTMANAIRDIAIIERRHLKVFSRQING